jgi:hypothetical protein
MQQLQCNCWSTQHFERMDEYTSTYFALLLNSHCMSYAAALLQQNHHVHHQGGFHFVPTELPSASAWNGHPNPIIAQEYTVCLHICPYK